MSPEPIISTYLGLGAVVLLILLTGFFVAAEFALVAVDRSNVERRSQDGDRAARRIPPRCATSPSSSPGRNWGSR